MAGLIVIMTNLIRWMTGLTVIVANLIRWMANLIRWMAIPTVITADLTSFPASRNRFMAGRDAKVARRRGCFCKANTAETHRRTYGKRPIRPPHHPHSTVRSKKPSFPAFFVFQKAKEPETNAQPAQNQPLAHRLFCLSTDRTKNDIDGAELILLFSKEIMPKKSQRRWGCLTIGLMIVFGFVALIMAANWWSARPKQMLSRFLNVEWSDKVTKLDTHFVGGMDFTAHIYLEADAATVDRILAKGNFAKTSTPPDSRMIERLNFKDVPDARSESLIHYSKHEGTVLEYAATTPDGRKLWYAAYDH